MGVSDGDNDIGDPRQHNNRKQSAANCTEEVAKSVLMLLKEKFSPSLCNRNIF